MEAALSNRDASSESSPPASRGLYTYLVCPTGVLASVSHDGAEELHFQARLSRTDNWTREQSVVVRNTHDRPDLIARVRDALGRARSVRMVVKFERAIREESDKLRHMRTFAVVESLLEPARKQADLRQLDLFV